MRLGRARLVAAAWAASSAPDPAQSSAAGPCGAPMATIAQTAEPSTLMIGIAHQASAPVAGNDSTMSTPPKTTASRRHTSGVAAYATTVSSSAASGTCQPSTSDGWTWPA
ncbi:hypothetical protein ACFQX7_23915 [Luedemannella flava]